MRWDFHCGWKHNRNREYKTRNIVVLNVIENKCRSSRHGLNILNLSKATATGGKDGGRGKAVMLASGVEP